MAQLSTLCFTSCKTSIPHLFSSSSLHSSNFHTFSLSSITPKSLFLRHPRHPHHPIIRCSASSSTSILTPENPLSISQQENHDEEVSSTRLLAQNVPWSATADGIRSLFQNYGTVVDVELSMYSKTKNRGLAFVEMGSAVEAAEAFAKLEAFEYEGRTLKLAYAKPKKKKTSPLVNSKPAVVYNLFLANLPYEARAKDLKELFQSSGREVISADAIFKDNPRRSSGYGFVSFKSKKEADDALLAFQGKELIGRPIKVAQSKQFVKLKSETNTLTQDEQDLSTDSSQSSEKTDTAITHEI